MPMPTYPTAGTLLLFPAHWSGRWSLHRLESAPPDPYGRPPVPGLWNLALVDHHPDAEPATLTVIDQARLSDLLDHDYCACLNPHFALHLDV